MLAAIKRAVRWLLQPASSAKLDEEEEEEEEDLWWFYIK